MSVSAAQTAAANLRTALLDNGVRSVSIELQSGAGSSGWGVAPFKRGLGHHIASRPSQGKTPGLALVKKGRLTPGPLYLPGPLCNGYGGYDLTARIICMSYANHPGAGGPWSVPGWGTVPKDNGRPYIFGWEFEGGYEPYTDEMHDFMARCGAGTLDWLGTLPSNPGPAPLECWNEHKGWAGPRKPDRIGYTTASGRSRIAAVRNQKEEDDDMALFENIGQFEQAVNRAAMCLTPSDRKSPWAYDMIAGTDQNVMRMVAEMAGLRATLDTLAKALVAQDNGLDETRLKALLDESLAAAAVKLADAVVQVDVKVAGRTDGGTPDPS